MGSGASKRKKAKAGQAEVATPAWAKNGGFKKPQVRTLDNSNGRRAFGSRILKTHSAQDVQSQLRRREVAKNMSVMKKAKRKIVRGTRSGSLTKSPNQMRESDFPKIPKSDKATEIIVQSLRTNFLFSGESRDQLLKIASVMTEEQRNPGDTIIEQGELPADKFYVVGAGDVEFFTTGEDGLVRRLGGASRGGNFGELALMYACPRTASVRVERTMKGFCRLWVLSRDAFRFFRAASGSRDVGVLDDEDSFSSPSSCNVDLIKIMQKIPLLNGSIHRRGRY
jgi:hypothetical protein